MNSYNIKVEILPDRNDIPEFKMFEFINELGKQLSVHLEKIKNIDKFNLVFQRFTEYLLALERKKNEFELAFTEFEECKNLSDQEKEEILKDAKENNRDCITVSYVDHSFRQMQLVFCIENLHQQIYSTISCFSLVLSFLLPQSILSQMPRNSMEKFIQFFKETNLRDSLLENIEILERSIFFRSKFIVHPQSHAKHTWMTMGTENDIIIGYFIPLFNEKEKEEFRKHNPDVPLPPFEKDSFYISPESLKTYSLFKEFVIGVIKKLNSFDFIDK